MYPIKSLMDVILRTRFFISFLIVWTWNKMHTAPQITAHLFSKYLKRPGLSKEVYISKNTKKYVITFSRIFIDIEPKSRILPNDLTSTN